MINIQHIITSVVKVSLGSESFVSVGDLSAEVNIAGDDLELRDLLRYAFVALGIDIEFSGKGIHEKGVVVDMDEDLTVTLGIDPNILRFGQTVVRCAAGSADDIVPDGALDIIENSANKTAEEIVTERTLGVLQVLKNQA